MVPRLPRRAPPGNRMLAVLKVTLKVCMPAAAAVNVLEAGRMDSRSFLVMRSLPARRSADLPYRSRAVTVNVTGAPTVAEVGRPARRRLLALPGTGATLVV